LLKYVNESELGDEAKRYLKYVRDWDLQATPGSRGQTVYQCWMDSLESLIWKDDISKSYLASTWPDEQTTMELLLRDSTAMTYIDNINTPGVETLNTTVTEALNMAARNLVGKENEGRIEWSKFKNPTIYHLLKESLMPFARRGLDLGGSGNVINALTHSHGPSWRMVVHLADKTEAYGVYPSGQSGNPGSKYYDNFVDTWAKGEYFNLWMMRRSETASEKIRWTMRFAQQ
jgi:penicillin amidase